MKIYSIKEIVDATNSFLNNTPNDKTLKKTMNKKKLLLLTDEPQLNKKDQKSFSKNNTNTNLKVSKENEKSDLVEKDNLVEDMYLKFSKKIKKNTLKLIFELQKELSNLKKIKQLLNLSNDELKIKVNNLSNEIIDLNEKNKKLSDDKNSLNEKTKILTDKLKLSHNEIENLKENKNKLENEVKDKSLLNDKIYELNLKLNSTNNEIEDLKNIKVELEKEISEHKSQHEKNMKKIYDISEVENKNKFFQDENLRIGSELLEVKKKHDILKKEIEKYENQKSNLISKINSVNEALSDTNILTNVFENKVEKKVDIIDHNKIEKKISTDLDEQIKSIFSNNS